MGRKKKRLKEDVLMVLACEASIRMCKQSSSVLCSEHENVLRGFKEAKSVSGTRIGEGARLHMRCVK